MNFQILLILIGGLWPLAPALLVFLFLTRKTILKWFRAGLDERLKNVAWLENLLNFLNTLSTSGTIVAGFVGVKAEDDFTTVMAVVVFVAVYFVCLLLRQRLESVKADQAEEQARAIAKAVLAERDKGA